MKRAIPHYASSAISLPCEQEYRAQNGLPILENLWRDLTFAVRTLRRNPAFAASCIATFAVGLGAMITVLCAVSALLWKPLPYPNPDRLVVIREVDPRSGLWPFSRNPVSSTSRNVPGRSRQLCAFRRGVFGIDRRWRPREHSVRSRHCVLFGHLRHPADRWPACFRIRKSEVVIARGLWKAEMADESCRNWASRRASMERITRLPGSPSLPADLLPGGADPSPAGCPRHGISHGPTR